MSYHPCVSGCGRFLAPQDSHDRCLTCLGIQHVEEAFVDGSCSSCGDMTISELRNSPSASAAIWRSSRHPGRRCIWWSQRWSEDYGEGFLRRSSSPLKHSSAGVVAVGAGWDLCRAGYTTHFLRCSPWRPDVDRCIGGWALSLRGWRLGCVSRFGCGSIVRARPRDDGYAFPGRVSILRGWTSGFSVGVALVLSAPLRCHSFRKCMRSLQDHGRHLSLPETNLVAPPPSPPSMVGPLWGTRASPRWSGL